MSCEHDWRTGPVVSADMKCQTFCVRCYANGTMTRRESQLWPKWTDDDYYEHWERIDPAAYHSLGGIRP